MNILRTLSGYDSQVSSFLRGLLDDLGVRNCFNPSFVYHGEMIIIAFRAYGQVKDKPFNSYLLIYNQADQSQKIINLTVEYSQYEISVVADPKLVNLFGDVWVTFNSGFSRDSNKLYLAKIYPDMDKPYLCEYLHRAGVEKNWAFFVEGDVLKAIYSLTPLVVLSVSGRDDVAHILYFCKGSEDVVCTENESKLLLSIGTQIVIWQGRMFLIAHVKKFFWGKRIYLGLPVIVDRGNGGYVLSLAQKKIVHSYISMLGSPVKHNKNLFSCTYFSGFQIRSSRAILGYGVNDVDYSFKDVELNLLWNQ